MGDFANIESIWNGGRAPLVCSAQLKLSGQMDGGALLDWRSLAAGAQHEVRMVAQYGWVKADAGRQNDIEECARYMMDLANGVGARAAARGSGKHPIDLGGYFAEEDLDDMIECLGYGHMMEIPCLSGGPRKSGAVQAAADLKAIERRLVSTAIRTSLILRSDASISSRWRGVEIELLAPEEINILGTFPLSLNIGGGAWQDYCKQAAVAIEHRELAKHTEAALQSGSRKSKSI